ncbi:MAG: GHMP kinase [Planctomycetaceae bacterium]|nr:GHMP kinase [Planctomycetaceae bacterium]
MELLRRRAYARAGLMGNPSDGYHGKTLSVIVRNFRAEVVLYEWEDVEIVLTQEDRVRFPSVRELVRDVDLHGYYGGIRLVKATIKKFVEYCRGRHALHDRNFSIRYATNIPRQVGLAGSSAIIVATTRALMEFYQVAIPLDVQPSFVLSVERDELGIAAGLQDRVVQVYGGLVYMDFSRTAMVEKHGLWCGRYEPLDPTLLPPLYLAYSEEAGEPTEVFHNNLRARYDAGEPAVVEAMREFAGLAQQAREALVQRQTDRLAALIDRNFDLRCSICRLPRAHLEMIEVARRVGASAKFAGSGGAIIGVYRDDAMFHDLTQALGDIGCRVIRPDIA